MTKNWIKKISDKDLNETTEFFLNKGFIKIEDEIVEPKDESEIKEIILDRLKSYLEDRRKDIEISIAELRKSGKDVEVLWIKSLQLPLKIKVFLATYSKKDVENILNRFEEIELGVKSFSK